MNNFNIVTNENKIEHNLCGHIFQIINTEY